MAPECLVRKPMPHAQRHEFWLHKQGHRLGVKCEFARQLQIIIQIFHNIHASILLIGKYSNRVKITHFDIFGSLSKYIRMNVMKRSYIEDLQHRDTPFPPTVDTHCGRFYPHHAKGEVVWHKSSMAALVRLRVEKLCGRITCS